MRTLVREMFSVGDHSVTWNGRTSNGRAASSGVYYVRLMAGELNRATRITLVK